MPEFFASPPWYLPTTFAAIAVVLLMQGNNRQEKRLKTAGLVSAIIAVLLYSVGYVFESGFEKATRKTEELAAAVDKRDWAAFKLLLDPQVRFFTYNGKDEFAVGAEQSAEKVGVKNISVSIGEVTDVPGGYVVDFSATADIDAVGRRMPTNWRFHWGKPDFLLYRIDYVANPQFGEDAVFSRLAPPK